MDFSLVPRETISHDVLKDFVALGMLKIGFSNSLQFWSYACI